ncbi:Gamma-aminobutyric acid receptor subunit rho-3 [Heterocephalus glaber]|uniref:Gamma-aminobutyric acid receptor subunit rho-3 n=1 Tax=Heterocephalus glaber TaxID=10181 RepID=G5BXD5_HETGA|nr:Gamma-aminobutyric acid receptor subunit rho-3 [Heterocephalus glaber]
MHDATMGTTMLRVHPDGSVLFSISITVLAMCFMDFSRFPLDTQNCSLKLESYAYNEEDLMLYWKHGNKSLNTEEHISLSQFFIEEFSASSGLAFYGSTGITMVLTMSTIITGVSASMPQVSYVKAMDVYLWVSSLFVFLSVIEYAAVNYLTTVEEQEQFKKKGKISGMYNMDAVQAMAFDGCYHYSKSEMDQNSFSLHSEEDSMRGRSAGSPSTDSSQIKRRKSLRGIILANNHATDTYSRILFPILYIIFNLFYWCVHV